jgi:hypothetical protein
MAGLSETRILRRIEKAKTTQRASDGELHDPIESDSRFSSAIIEARRKAERESSINGMGRCHDVWGQHSRNSQEARDRLVFTRSHEPRYSFRLIMRFRIRRIE